MRNEVQIRFAQELYDKGLQRSGRQGAGYFLVNILVCVRREKHTWAVQIIG
jgi:hypothetical protein